MSIGSISGRVSPDIVQPSDLSVTWLIARRAAIESLRDQTTRWMSTVVSIAVPLGIVLLELRRMVVQTGADSEARFGLVIASFLLVVGLMPSSSSIGIAAGLFAGEREQGSLLPLLASPASNRAIFAGKVLGAVLPPLLYAAIAEASYFAEIGLFIGLPTLRLMPFSLSVTLLALVPGNAVLGAAIASLVSSRVRTFQSAQMLSSLAVFPVMGIQFGLAIQMQRWGPELLVIAVVGLFALDLALIGVSAATWRREEVMARH